MLSTGIAFFFINLVVSFKKNLHFIDVPSIYERGLRFMADKIFENNQVTITGEVVSEFQYSH